MSTNGRYCCDTISSNVPASTEITPLSMDIVRFGMSVAEYQSLRDGECANKGEQQG